MSKLTLRRLRTFAARVILKSRRIAAHFTTPDAVETLMANLPRVEAAATLAGRRVLVTGAGQGVGRVLARAFAAEGATVILTARNRAPLDAVAGEVRAAGGKAEVIAADVASEADAARLVAEAGAIDILINNAGIGGPWGKPFWENAPADFAETLAINVTGPFQIAAGFAKAALSAGRGLRILNVSSIATEGSHRGIAAYTTSKLALEGLTRAMATDAERSGIVVCSVSLNSVQTERKAAHDWAGNALLPPAESVVPAFLHAATAPAAEVQGRQIAAWRFLADREAETRLAGRAAGIAAIAYPPFRHKGAFTARDPVRFTILDRAENAWGPSPAVVPAMQAAIARAPLSYYPEERHDTLTAALATHIGLPAESFAIGPGSWELLARLVAMFVKPGEEVVSNSPGWFGFNMVCDRAGVARSMAPFDLGTAANRPSHNLAAVLERVGPLTRLVYLIHPSNPEGVALRADEMREFLAGLPPRLPVIIDEAYIEYAGGEGLFDTVAAVRAGGHSVIGLRTFSKFHALAAARVGYAYAAPPIADLIRRQEHIFPVSALSEAAAVAALTDTAHQARIKAAFCAERARLTEGLARRGLAPLPSEAPYVLALRPGKAEAMFDALEDAGLYIARYAFHDGRFMMFPVGKPEVTDRIFATLDGEAG